MDDMHKSSAMGNLRGGAVVEHEVMYREITVNTGKITGNLKKTENRSVEQF